MTEHGSHADSLRALLETRVAAHDRPGMVAESLRAVDAGEVDIPTLYHDVLVPLIKSVGDRWQDGSIRIWEEHLATAAVRTIVEALHPRVQALKTAAAPNGKSVLLACPAGERHDLGLRMLADVFEASGWSTYYLGADTPTDQLIDAASSLGVDLVVLASVTLVDQLQTGRIVERLRERLPHARVTVACSGDVCSDTTIRESDIFVSEEFLGGPHPRPSTGLHRAGGS